MASADSFGAKGTLDVGDASYQIYRLSAVEGDGLDVDSLPFSLKVLLENLLRTEDGEDITADDIKALGGWDADADPDKEIQFTPARRAARPRRPARPARRARPRRGGPPPSRSRTP